MNCLNFLMIRRPPRSTQFAGDHPYCIEHASREKDFGENDSYAYWYELSSSTGDPVASELQKSPQKIVEKS